MYAVQRSNIWNIVFIIGATATMVDIEVVRQIMIYDMWVMFFATIMLLPVMLTGRRLDRVEGSLFLISYILYLVSQVLIVKGVWSFN